jgi:hypothetical protein
MAAAMGVALDLTYFALMIFGTVYACAPITLGIMGVR